MFEVRGTLVSIDVRGVQTILLDNGSYCFFWKSFSNYNSKLKVGQRVIVEQEYTKFGVISNYCKAYAVNTNTKRKTLKLFIGGLHG